jgi:hypothetical protein
MSSRDATIIFLTAVKDRIIQKIRHCLGDFSFRDLFYSPFTKRSFSHVSVHGKKLSFVIKPYEIKPYEIKTLKVEFKV